MDSCLVCRRIPINSFFMKRCLPALLWAVFIMPLCLRAQIVNTEVKRINTGGDTAFVNLFGGYSFTRSIFRATSARVRGQGYLIKKGSIIMILADYQLNTFNNVRNVFSQLAHVRYTKDFGDFSEGGKYLGGGFLSPEVFQQVQLNQVQLIDVRWLTGAGVRMRLHEGDSLHLYMGTIGMFEYENTNGNERPERNRDLRLSTYASVGVWITPYMEIRSTTYFQPRLNEIADYRISTETNLSIIMNKWLSLNTSYNLSYDSRPPRQVEEGFETTLEDTFVFVVAGLEINF